MTFRKTQTLGADAVGIATAARIISAGGLVAFPTETVYGLGADARNDQAVARIFAAKARPQFNPLIVHVADLASARTIGHFGDVALRLAGAFWPGPLTIVVPIQPESGLSKLVTSGLSTVGIRVPENPVAQQILHAFGGPVAAPSANLSGQISPTCAAHVAQGLGGRIDAIVDGGTCDVGLESTIVGTAGDPALLRPGGLPAEAIETCLGLHLLSLGDAPTPTSPGQLASHYAPHSKMRLNAVEKRAGEVLLGFGDAPGADINLSETGDLVAAAAALFSALHKLDTSDAATIAVSPIPEIGLGRAINDRLRRAAAPRP